MYTNAHIHTTYIQETGWKGYSPDFGTEANFYNTRNKLEWGKHEQKYCSIDDFTVISSSSNANFSGYVLHKKCQCSTLFLLLILFSGPL